MEVSSSHQLTVFFIYVLSGFICGTFFDVQRVLRRMYAADLARTSIEDLLFAVFVVFMAIAPGFICNNGEMRYYQIVGILCGGILYALVLSRVVTKILYFVIRLVSRIIILPIAKLCQLFIALFNKITKKVKSFKTLAIRVKKKLFRHFRRKRKSIEKRIKML